VNVGASRMGPTRWGRPATGSPLTWCTSSAGAAAGGAAPQCVGGGARAGAVFEVPARGRGGLSSAPPSRTHGGTFGDTSRRGPPAGPGPRAGPGSTSRPGPRAGPRRQAPTRQAPSSAARRRTRGPGPPPVTGGERSAAAAGRCDAAIARSPGSRCRAHRQRRGRQSTVNVGPWWARVTYGLQGLRYGVLAMDTTSTFTGGALCSGDGCG